MNRFVPALLAATVPLLVVPPAVAAPAGHGPGFTRPIVVSQNTVSNQADGVYHSQKFVYSTTTGFPQGAPAGTLATLRLDEGTPVFSHGKGPQATVVDQHGQAVDVTVNVVKRAGGDYDLVAAQPLPRHALLRTRTLVSADATVGGQVRTTITAGRKTASDVDAVRAMPKVTAITKDLTDGRSVVAAGQHIDYVATGSFTGEVLDGATLVFKQSPSAKVVGRPTVEVRDASGRVLVIDPERLLYSRYGDSLVWTVLGAIPQGSTITLHAHAVVSADARPGDVLSTEFGIGLNNWAGGKLIRAVDTTTVA